MKKILILLMLIVVVIAGCQTAIITKTVLPEEITINQFTDSATVCSRLLGQMQNQYPNSQWGIATCRECPKVKTTTIARCNLACGSTCPVGYSCSFPPNCATGGCVASTTLCGGTPCLTCNPTGLDFWEPEFRGCFPSITTGSGAYLFMVEKDKLNTQEHYNAEALYQSTCIGQPVNTSIGIDPGTNIDGSCKVGWTKQNNKCLWGDPYIPIFSELITWLIETYYIVVGGLV